MSRAKSFPSTWRRAFTRTRHGTPHDVLTPTAVAVGLVMSEYASWETGGGIRPGHARIATVVGVSQATVKRAVALLLESGWIAEQQRGGFGRASVFQLVIPPLVDERDGTISSPVTGSLVSPWGSRNGVTGEPLTGSLVSHQLWRTTRCRTSPLASAA